ncbi:MAG TPA: hypothetical protein PLZ74_00475 [Kiritimatiellia bacterium]|nr:hypothetical protein [Kiritimatiellia bacterium]
MNKGTALSYVSMLFATLVAFNTFAQRFTIENHALRRTLTTEGGVLRTEEIENKLNKSVTPLSQAPEFRLRFSEGTHRPETAFTLTSADFELATIKQAPRKDSEPLSFTLRNAKHGITIAVAFSVNATDAFLHKQLTVTSGKPITLERIDVDALTLPDAYQPYTTREITAQAPARWSPGLGQPLYGAKSATFWGVEFPAADNLVNEKLLLSGYLWGRQLQAGVPYKSYRAVMGVADDPAFVSDAFRDYITQRRVRPLRLQTQFNSWFDRGRGVNKENFKEAVEKIHKELVVERGCAPLKAYVVDDGWQDVHADWSGKVWKVNSKFDADFASTLTVIREAKSTLGLWLSPGCLFGASAQVDKLRGQGFEALDVWMSMAGPKYMQALEDRVLELTKQGVGFFKLDGIFGHLNRRTFELKGDKYGLPIMPQLGIEGFKSDDKRLNDSKYDELKIYYLTAGTERLMEIFKKQAAINPEVYIVISNGAWLSPWWLMYIDSVWMINAGDAAGGSSRTEELVYRDSIYYKIWTEQKTQFPISALFNHEPKKTGSNESKEVFRKYLYMNLARGTGFVELYITPRNLAAYDWDVIAEGLQWVKEVFPTFSRAKMFGGDPGKREVYGYTGWQGGVGYIALHNPSEEPSDFVCRLDRAFGLQQSERPERFIVSSPLEGSTRGLPDKVQYGDTMTIRLEPREIRIINFDVASRDWSALKTLQTRTQADYVPPPPKPQPKPIPVGNHPLLGVWEYQHNGTTYTREFVAEGNCILKQGNNIIWTKPVTSKDKNTLIVDDCYTHRLQPDGTLVIENHYKAKRKK